MLDSYKKATIKDLGEIIKIYNSTVSSGVSTADTKEVCVESRLEWFKT